MTPSGLHPDKRSSILRSRTDGNRSEGVPGTLGRGAGIAVEPCRRSLVERSEGAILGTRVRVPSPAPERVAARLLFTRAAAREGHNSGVGASREPIVVMDTHRARKARRGDGRQRGVGEPWHGVPTFRACSSKVKPAVDNREARLDKLVM